MYRASKLFFILKLAHENEETRVCQLIERDDLLACRFQRMGEDYNPVYIHKVLFNELSPTWRLRYDMETKSPHSFNLILTLIFGFSIFNGLSLAIYCALLFVLITYRYVVYDDDVDEEKEEAGEEAEEEEEEKEEEEEEEKEEEEETHIHPSK